MSHGFVAAQEPSVAVAPDAGDLRTDGPELRDTEDDEAMPESVTAEDPEDNVVFQAPSGISISDLLN